MKRITLDGEHWCTGWSDTAKSTRFWQSKHCKKVLGKVRSLIRNGSYFWFYQRKRLEHMASDSDNSLALYTISKDRYSHELVCNDKAVRPIDRWMSRTCCCMSPVKIDLRSPLRINSKQWSVKLRHGEQHPLNETLHDHNVLRASCHVVLFHQ